MRSRWLAIFPLAFCGCSVDVALDSQNQRSAAIPCDASNPCGSGMTCINYQCRAADPTISHVLADVSLPASTSAGQYSGMSFVVLLDVPTSGQSDIILPDLGSLTLDAVFPTSGVSGQTCDYSADNADFHVEATHRWPVDGLERADFVANSLPAKLSPIPVGFNYNYELYVAVKSHDANCQLPPVLVRDVLASANQSLTLSWPSPTAIALDVQLQTANVAASEDPLVGWQLDVVDPVQGRLLANPVTLGSGVPDTSGAVLHYRASVNYNPIVSAGSSPLVGTELIRLQPPSQQPTYPTYYESMSSLTLFSGTTTELPFPIKGVPAPVHINGRVETADVAQALQASITFSGTGFNVSNNGIIATFSSSVTSQSDGSFQVDLPAGDYHVLVVPPGDGKYAVLNTDWSINSSQSSQGGRLLQVPGYSEILGNMTDSSVRSWSQAATIAATPSMGLVTDTSSQIIAIRNASSGARTASVLFQPQTESAFSLPVDTGIFDVSLRPPEGHPWLVSPWITVNSDTSTLPDWSMPKPASWSGKLQVPAKDPTASPNSLTLPRSVVRIYALASDAFSSNGERLVVDSPQDAKAIVQIAESRTLADGSFELVLPDKFHR